MTLALKIGAWFLAPFFAASAFFGLGSHSSPTAGPMQPYSSTTPWTATSSPVTASTTESSSTSPAHVFHRPLGPGPVVIPMHKVSITSETPTSGPAGTQVTLTGTGFTSDSIVHFAAGAISNPTISPDGTSISFDIPNSIGPYCKPDQACPMYEMLVTPNTYKVYVENSMGSSTPVDFTVTAGGTGIVVPQPMVQGSAAL